MYWKKKLVIYPTIAAVLGGMIALGHVSFKWGTASAEQKEPQPHYVNSLQQLAAIPIIKDKVLKANQNYKFLHGVVVSNDQGNTSQEEVWIGQPDKFRLVVTPNINNPNQMLTAINDGKHVQVKETNGQIKDFASLHPIGKPSHQADNEVVPDLNGTFLPDDTGDINEMLHPEMLEQSAFRFGSLTIEGKDIYINRPVTKIDVQGKVNKLGDDEKFWIDNETGIVLKMELYNQGKLLRSSAFQSINFSDISDSNFSMNTPTH